MRDRIKEIRKAMRMSQTEFGKALGVSLSAVQKWESGENYMSDAVVLLVCQKFGVSEAWLVSGDGEMFSPKDREQEIREFVAALFKDDSLEFRRRLVTVLARLDSDGWSALEKIADALEKEDC